MSSRRRGRSRRGGNSRSETSSGDAKRKLRPEEGSGFEAWGGYMQAKMQKLNDQFNTGDTAGTGIFTGIHVYVNGYTKPSSDELRRLLTLHGGVFEQYLYRTRVTHIVATNLPDSKVRELRGMKVVKPEWITESVSAGRLLPYTSYQLYTAQSRSQHGLNTYTKTSILSRTSSTASADSSTLLRDNNGEQMLSEDGESDEDLSKLRTKDIERLHSSENSFDGDLDNGSTTKDSIEERPPMTSLASSERLTGSYHDKSAMKMAKAGDSNFLSEFYTHSRLHHISTWGAEYRAYVTQLQKQSDGGYPGRERLRQYHHDNVEKSGVDTLTTRSGKPKRVIMHVDMDCFFVSVGLLDKPELRGRPVAVTHSRGKGVAQETPGSDFQYEKSQWQLRAQQKSGKKGRQAKHGKSAQIDHTDLEMADFEEGEENEDNANSSKTSPGSSETFHSMAEIASCSYEARKVGVKNGMFMGAAKKMCPDLVTIPYNFDKYQQVSRALYDTVASFTHDIEAVSCDEMLVDCTDLLADTGATPDEFATLLRAEIHEKTGCNASAGLSGNILLARLATRSAKPNGQFYLTQDNVPEFITKQSVRDLPGVGYSMSRKLGTMSVTSCGDLQKLTLTQLQKVFGPKTGQSLHRFCRGQDDRPIKMEKERKSVSAEINYGIRFQKETEAERFLVDLSDEVATRLKGIGMKGKTITLKVMVRRSDAPKETAKFMGHGICNNMSKSCSLPVATDDGKLIARECITLLRSMKAQAADLRGIGIQTHRLEAAVLGGGASGGGNQSILSFAVPKQQSVQPAALSPSTTFKSPPSSSTSRKAPIDVSYVNDVDDDYNNDVEDDDEAIVFSCSSGPIQEELSRKKASKHELPPLPMLPSFGTPETPTNKRVVGESREAMDYFPSPSQIDPEVLKELPPEIRDQIERDMAEKCAKVKTIPPPANKPRDGPGCSHWPSQEESANDTAPEVQEEEPQPIRDEETETMDTSQLDESFLNALPEDIQEELRTEFAQKKKKSDNLPEKALPSLQLQQAKSPSKSPNKKKSPRKSPSKSPGRGKKKSPVFKVPRGRPVGSKNKTSGPKKQLDFKTQSKLSTPVPAQDKNTEVIVIDTPPAPVAIATNPTSDTTTTPHTSETEVNLCGAVSLQEVRELIVEWLHSCPEPQCEDVEVMLEYVGKLVLDHNLEQLDLVLKFMHRQIRKLANDLWRKSFDNIISNTQEVISSVYGSKLDTSWITT